MKTCNKLSIKIIRKIVFISIILIGMLTIGVIAAKSNLNTVTIVCSDDCELSVVTSETNVGKILEENYIILLDDEKVEPSVDSNIDFSKKIVISKVTEEPKIVAEEVSNVSTEEILGNYVTITEKIVTEQQEIPYETVTKDISASGTQTTNKVVQAGENGLKETKYKVKYQDDVEIEKTIISEQVIKEPVDKIVQISTKVTSRSGVRSVSAAAVAASVEGITPKVVTMNASAYCSCSSCCGKSTGRTSSGAYAQEWYTLAAGSGYPIGTIIYIPAFANKPNGGWFEVQDRGGAISNSRIDVYMGSHSAALSFGRRNLECYVYTK
ncbi:MAG: G5 domain-containing protein [Clostridia bacterium]|nr:G5 domain-containing protein [Clostridia bacterium]